MSQQAIMSVITNSKYIAHTNPIFKTLNLLKLPDLYRIQLYKLLKKQTNINNCRNRNCYAVNEIDIL